jgi:hypothetical protein
MEVTWYLILASMSFLIFVQMDMIFNSYIEKGGKMDITQIVLTAVRKLFLRTSWADFIKRLMEVHAQ